MSKKILFLLIGWMLVASSGLYAQSGTVLLYEDEEEIITTTQEDPVDVAVEPQEVELKVLERTWGYNLEDYLKDKIVYLSDNPNTNKVSKQEIEFVYKVFQVPCKSGKQTVYLSMTVERDFILSKENPVTLDEVCGCFLELQLPEKVVATPSKHQTDDSIFGQPVSDGKNRKIINDF